MRVRLFAALREIAGSSSVDANVADSSDAEAVLDALTAAYGDEFRRIARAGTLVVNGEPAGWDHPLSPGDEVVLLPPVSGGEEGTATRAEGGNSGRRR